MATDEPRARFTPKPRAEKPAEHQHDITIQVYDMQQREPAGLICDCGKRWTVTPQESR